MNDGRNRGRHGPSVTRESGYPGRRRMPSANRRPIVPEQSRTQHRGAAMDPIGRHAPLELPCQIHDRELWFADEPARLERAKQLCTGCPAQYGCLTGAIERREHAGVWGGQIFDRGRIVSHKRPRGRPRKNSVSPQRQLAGRAVAALVATEPVGE